MKFFVVLLVLLLTACSSPPKISLGGDAPVDEKSKKFIIDDTRYYKTKDRDFFYRIDDDAFTPSPKPALNAKLASTLNANSDQKVVRLKKLSIYFAYSRSELQAGVAMGLGAAIGGGAGLGLMAAASSPRTDLVTAEDPDRQTIGCDFLARFNGRIIEFYLSEPACDDQKRICIRRNASGNLPLDNPSLQKKVESITQACLDNAVAQINVMKDLPPLADTDQEAR